MPTKNCLDLDQLIEIPRHDGGSRSDSETHHYCERSLPLVVSLASEIGKQDPVFLATTLEQLERLSGPMGFARLRWICEVAARELRSGRLQPADLAFLLRHLRMEYDATYPGAGSTRQVA